MSAVRYAFAILLVAGMTNLAVASAAEATTEPVSGATGLAELGYLDVTRYGADPSGKRDSTEAINQAISDAYDERMIAWFPSGTYLISDTLEAFRKRGSGRTRSTVLVGSTQGARPTIRLADKSAGFGVGTAHGSKEMLYFWTQAKQRHDASGKPLLKPAERRDPANQHPANGFNQMVRNLRFECGRGNPGCVAIRMHAAQGSSIESVTADLSHGGFAGIRNLPGRGWGGHDITLIGGQYGIYADEGAGATLVGVTARGQTVQTLRYGGFIPLTIVGFEFSLARGPAIKTQRGWSTGGGNLVLMDGSIDVAAAGELVIDNTEGRSFYARNVWLRSAGPKLIRSGSGPAFGARNTWTRLNEYSYTNPDSGRGKLILDNVSFVDGASVVREFKTTSLSAPPADLVSRHLTVSADVETAGAVNAKQFGVKGDGRTDDRAALQAVLDAHEVVFLPKGDYLLGGTLRLNKHNHLFGVARHLTRIAPSPDWLPTREVPLIQTVDDADATTRLATVTLADHGRIPFKHNFHNMLHWRAGRHSVVFGVSGHYMAHTTERRTQARSHARISNNGGGRWYWLDHGWARQATHRGRRILTIEGTREPLWVYGYNPEHVRVGVMTEIRDARNIRIMGSKTEGGHTALIDNVSNFGWFGYGGTANPASNRARVEVINSTDFVLGLLSPKAAGTHPNAYTLREVHGDKVTVVGSDHVVPLFKRGDLSDDAMVR